MDRSNAIPKRRGPAGYRPLDETRRALSQKWREISRDAFWINTARTLCIAAGLDAGWAMDVLHETLARIGEGRRAWPKDVAWEPFFRETMSSVASNIKQQESRTDSTDEIEHVPDAQDVERDIFCSEVQALAEVAIAGDSELELFYRYRCDGHELADIGLKMNLSPNKLEALRRKYNRRLRKCVAEHIQGTPKK